MEKMKEAEMRHRSRDTETGAEGGCQSFGDCSHQHSGASGFEESLSWQAKVTRHALYRKMYNLL